MAATFPTVFEVTGTRPPGPDGAGRVASVAADLHGCPVRKRYLWQVVRYGPTVRAWRRALEAAAVEGDAGLAALPDLRALLRAAETETLHYPRAFAEAGVHWRDLRAVDDLAAFPILDRGTLQRRYYDLFHRAVGRRRIEEGWLGETSGSTGEPVRFFMDGDSIHFFTAFLRFLWRRLVDAPSPRPATAGIVLLCTLPRSAIYRTWMPLFSWTSFRKLHWAEPGAGATLGALDPAVVTGDPASLARLAEALERGETDAAPRLVVSSAFALPLELAARLRELSGAAVVDSYSMAETGPIAWRCPLEVERWHVLDRAAIVESVEGEIVVTNLRNRWFPLVRYRTGDLGTVESADTPCACGVRGAVLRGLGGRRAASFVARTGRRVDPSQLQPLLSRLPLLQFQLVQRDVATVDLRYFSDSDLRPDALAGVSRALARLVDGEVTVRPLRVEAPLFPAGAKPVVYRSTLG